MIELYGHPFSSHTWKARIALLANDTDHVFKRVDPGHPDNTAFVQSAHPAGKFLVLRDGDTVVIEATSIIEYLAQHHHGIAPLIPYSANQALTARMLDRVFDNYVTGNMQKVVDAYIANGENPDPAQIDSGKAGLRRAYAWLERWLGENQLPSDISLVSCAAAPSLFYADWVEPIPADCSRVAAYRAELLALPDIAHVVDDARPFRKLFPLGAPDRD